MKLIKSIIIVIMILIIVTILSVSLYTVLHGSWYGVVCWPFMIVGFLYSSIFGIIKFDHWFHKQLK